MVSLQYVLLLQRNVPRAAKYYSEGVGLKLIVLTEAWAELNAGGATIALKQTDGCGPARM
jgi:catechol-2,3-dioxygenase